MRTRQSATRGGDLSLASSSKSGHKLYRMIGLVVGNTQMENLPVPCGGTMKSGRNQHSDIAETCDIVSANDVEVVMMDDAMARRQLRNTQFRCIVAQLPVYDVANDEIIICGFLDVWSEIRKDCFRCIKESSVLLPSATTIRLLGAVVKVITNTCESWQSVHGGILCILALITGLPKSEVLELGRNLELDRHLTCLVAHTQQIVREEATKCLFSCHCLDSRSFIENIRFRLHMISLMPVPSTLEHETEGLLNIVQKYVETSIDFFGDIFCSELITVLADHLHSASSIIRQLTAQILLIAYKRSLVDDASDSLPAKVSDEIHNIVRTSLSAYSLNGQVLSKSWECTEAALIIVEEILNMSTMQFLSIQSEQEEPQLRERTICHAGFFDLVAVLHAGLPVCLYHAKFEIRRMAAQLIPALAKFVAVYSAVEPAKVVLHSYSETDSSVGFVESVRSRQLVARSLNCILATEISKALQLLLEVATASFDPFAVVNFNRKASDIVCSLNRCNVAVRSCILDLLPGDSEQYSYILVMPSSDVNQWMQWGLHTVGRLAEVESRRAFWLALKGHFDLSPNGKLHIEQAINNAVEMLLSFHIDRASADQAEDCNFGVILCDYVEAKVLTSTVLHFYSCKFPSPLTAHEAYRHTMWNGIELFNMLQAVQTSESTDVCSPAKQKSISKSMDKTLLEVKKVLFVDDDPINCDDYASLSHVATQQQLILPFLRDPSTNPLRLLSSLDGLCSDGPLASNGSRAISGRHISQYVCEAVCPALSALILLSFDELLSDEAADCWLLVAVNWIKASSEHKGWLDGMQYGRRSLFNSLWLLSIRLSGSARAGYVCTNANRSICDALLAAKRFDFRLSDSSITLAKAVASLGMCCRLSKTVDQTMRAICETVLQEWMASASAIASSASSAENIGRADADSNSEGDFSDWDAESDNEDEFLGKKDKIENKASDNAVTPLLFKLLKLVTMFYLSNDA